MTEGVSRIRPRSPDSIRIRDVAVLARTSHGDPRGFLLETLRKDDNSVGGDRFAMAYLSVTVPGEYRDRDRWHVHTAQTDRFVVALGEMVLALLDARPSSPTFGRAEVVRMAGVPYSSPSSPVKKEEATFLVAIPPGVYHCIGNKSTCPFVLFNAPTELYDAADEGRVPFVSVPVAELGGPFSWDLVEGEPPQP